MVKAILFLLLRYSGLCWVQAMSSTSFVRSNSTMFLSDASDLQNYYSESINSNLSFTMMAECFFPPTSNRSLKDRYLHKTLSWPEDGRKRWLRTSEQNNLLLSDGERQAEVLRAPFLYLSVGLLVRRYCVGNCSYHPVTTCTKSWLTEVAEPKKKETGLCWTPKTVGWALGRLLAFTACR